MWGPHHRPRQKSFQLSARGFQPGAKAVVCNATKFRGLGSGLEKFRPPLAQRAPRPCFALRDPERRDGIRFAVEFL